MNKTYVIPMQDSRATLDVAGGKGASLARLLSAGLPVPGGFHITTQAYRQFVSSGGLEAPIARALEQVRADQPATLDQASAIIRALFDQPPIPEEIIEAIYHSYQGLPGENPAVAVRSSATAEDLPDFSFAGQQESYLNVRGGSQLLQAVRDCWASLWTPRAIGYRQQSGIGQTGITLAVVVQLMVPAEVSGILFTADPTNGRRDQAVISASWGLGEAIVGGLVTPDTLTLDKESGQIASRITAEKRSMTVCTEGGTAERPTPAEQVSTASLSDQQAARLLRLGMEIESLYGMPMDIEWVLSQGQFSIVQARPITALPDEPLLRDVTWDVPDPDGLYARGSIIEFLPDPLTPLFGTLGKRIINRETRQLFSRLTGDTAAWPEHMFITINDYAYLNGITSRRQRWLMAKMMISMTRKAFTQGEAEWREVALPKYRRLVEKWRQRPVQEMSPQDLVDGVCQIMSQAANYYTTLQSGILAASMSSEAVFTGFYSRLVQREGDPPAMVFLLGFDNKAIETDKETFNLAGWCRSQPQLAAYLGRTAVSQLALDLTLPAGPAEVPTDQWQTWRHRFAALLNRYAGGIYNLDFACPTPVEDPALLLESCKLYLNGQIRNPHQRQEEAAAQREAAAAAVLSRLKGVRRRLFRRLLRWAQSAVPLREDCLADLGLGYPLLRSMLLELGGRLAQAGAIADANDIFWLTSDELEHAVAVLSDGDPLASYAAEVGQRMKRWHAERELTPPSVLPPGKKFMGLDPEKFTPAGTSSGDGDFIKGSGTSPGKITAVARVVHGPDDFDQLHPGEILVAAITTPAWTPLFAMASGVVTDVGGPLSHGSIVAREYGIPAVLGTGVATRRIKDGQRITVNGSTGIVAIGGSGRNGSPS